jgi:hypothetical protein
MNHTVIKAQVEDQSLLITNLPKLASGGYNETRVEFTFCPLWDGLAKTAMFYTDKSRVYYIVVEGDEAVVPHEVLANEGIVHFGVFGFSADQARTTEVLHLTVVEGAITDATAIHIDPTPDVYQQLLLIAQQIHTDVQAGIYTPKKGVDYWTPADKAEMKNDILAEFIDAAEVGL